MLGAAELLKETEVELVVAGLERLNSSLPTCWPSASQYLPDICRLEQDSNFPARKVASLVASKIYLALQEYKLAVKYALAAGDLFDINERSLYTDTITGKCIDEYTEARKSICDAHHEEATEINPQLEKFVNRIIDDCVANNNDNHALGIAIESRRLDKIQKIIKKDYALQYCFERVKAISNKKFSESVYKILADAFSKNLFSQNYNQYINCLYNLEDAKSVAKLLVDLLSKPADDSGIHENELIAYQLGFDLVDIGDQKFLKLILKELGSFENVKIKSILSGTLTTQLYLQFLHRANNTDLLQLEELKQNVEHRNSILHSGMVIAQAIAQAGTASDAFIRNNLEWMAKARNWAKFSATASIGVIHKGFTTENQRILSAYLPNGDGQPQPYSEGGALFAFGLIHANHYDENAKQVLMNQLNITGADEPTHHGACLGLGLVCLGTCDTDIYQAFKSILFTDSAVTGQSAAIATGLLMMDAEAEHEAKKAKREALLKKLQGTAYAFATEAGNGENKFNYLAKEVGNASQAGEKVTEFKQAATAFKASALKFREVGDILYELAPHLNCGKLAKKADAFQEKAEEFQQKATAITETFTGAHATVQPAIDQFKSAIDIFKEAAQAFNEFANAMSTPSCTDLPSKAQEFRDKTMLFAFEAILFDVKAQQVASNANLTQGGIHTNFKNAAEKFGKSGHIGAGDNGAAALFYYAIRYLAGKSGT